MKRIISATLVVILVLGLLQPLTTFAAETDSETISMELGKNYEVTMNGSETVYYNFTPEEDGNYCFESTGDYDVYASILDDSGEELDEDDDGGEDYNFKISEYLTAGQTYSLKIRSYEDDTDIEFNISVIKKVEVTLDTMLMLDYQKYYYGYEGDTVTLQVNAQSKVGNLTYTWYKDDDVIEGEIDDSCTVSMSEDISYSCKITDGTNTRWANFVLEIGTAGETKVKSISMTMTSQKKFYFYDITGNYKTFTGQINVNYEDGTTETISVSDCKMWDNIEEDEEGDWFAGNYTRYIYYKGAMTSYDITVVRSSQITNLSEESVVSGQITGGTSTYQYYSIMFSEAGTYNVEFSDITGNGQYQLISANSYGGYYALGVFPQKLTYDFQAGTQYFLVINATDEADLSYKVTLTSDVWEDIVLNEDTTFDGSNTYYYQYTPEKNGCYSVSMSDEDVNWSLYGYVYDENMENPVSISIDKVDKSTGVYLKANKKYYFKIYDWSKKQQGVVLTAAEYVDYPETIIAAGMYGTTMRWNLEEDGTLTVQSEDGKMPVCTWSSYASSIKKVELGENLEEIRYSAFYGCTNLAEIQLPEKLKTIGAYAFYNCSALQKVEFMGANNLSSIGNNAFYGTPWMDAQGNKVMLGNILVKYQSEETNIVVPSDVTYVGDYAMQKLPMENVTLQSSLKGIWSDAFACCSNLKKVTVPGNVMEVAYRAFAQCISLESIVLENGVQNLGEAAFYGCTKVKNVTVPGSVTDVAYKTFSDCTALESVVLEEGVKTVGEAAFLGSNALKSITIPKSVTEIGVNAIGYEWDSTAWKPKKSSNQPTIYCYANSAAYKYAVANGMPYVVVDAGNTNTGTNTNTNVNADTGAVLAKIGTKIDASQIEGSGGTVPPTSTFTITSNDPNNPTVAFDGVADENAKAVKIPEYIIYNGVKYTVTSVSIQNFKKKDSAAKYNVTNNSVSNLTVEYTGTTNKNKKTVSVPQYTTYKGVKYKVKSVKAKSFKNNKKITNVKIATGITKIGNDTFAGCTNLKTVTIGKSLNTIGKNAFKNCKKLKKITIKSTKLKSVGKNALKGVYAKCKIKVPKKCVKKYRKLFKKKGQKSSVKVTK